MTNRQKILLDRLAEMCRRFHSDILPVEVLEVIGFGSFFRGKGTPRDVDLCIRAKQSLHYPAFKQLMEQEVNKSSSETSKTPVEKLGSVLSNHPEIPKAVKNAYCRWLQPYTWGMLNPGTFFGSLVAISEGKVCERLFQDLPNIKIANWLGENEKITLTTNVTYSIWTPQDPDVTARVLAIWTSDLRPALLEEITNFDNQLHLLICMVDTLRDAYEKLLDTPNARTRKQDLHKWLLQIWLPKFGRGIDPKKLESAMDWRPFENEIFWPSPSSKKYESFTDDQVGQEIEIRRKQLKQFQIDLELWRTIFWQLALYRAGAVNRQTRIREYLVKATLENRYHKLSSDKQARSFLKSIGLSQELL